MKLFPEPSDGVEPASADISESVESTEAIALSEVAPEEVDIQKGCRLVAYTEPRGPAAERFRYLRIRLREPWETGKLKTVLVTSALPQDGKSTIALNLASSLCEHGRKRVLLIEGDLHRPSLALQLGLKPGPGLSECLEEGLDPIPFIRRLEPLGWYLLKAGGKHINPTELLQSGTLPGLLARLSPHFDWILLDSPPVLPVTDAVAMAREVDAVLMVVRAGSTPRDAVQLSLAQLGRRKLVAVVLNAIEASRHGYSDYGYYSDAANDNASTQSISPGDPSPSAKRERRVIGDPPIKRRDPAEGALIDDEPEIVRDEEQLKTADEAENGWNHNGQSTTASTSETIRAELKRRRNRFKAF